MALYLGSTKIAGSGFTTKWVPESRIINNHSLQTDFNLNASDIGSLDLTGSGGKQLPNQNLNYVIEPGTYFFYNTSTSQDLGYPSESSGNYIPCILDVRRTGSIVIQELYMIPTGSGNMSHFERSGYITSSDPMKLTSAVGWRIIKTIYSGSSNFLWSGSASIGDTIIIPNISKYNIISLKFSNSNVTLFAGIYNNIVHGIGGFSDGTLLYNIYFGGTLSGTSLNIVDQIETNYSRSTGSYTTFSTLTLKQIVGIC